MSVSSVNVFKNLDVGLLSLPVAIPALIVRGLQEGEDKYKISHPRFAKACSVINIPFRVINVLCGVPLAVYTLVKVAFAHLLLWATCGKVPCATKFTDFENNQITRVFKFMMFTMAGGLTDGAANEILQYGKV